MYLLFGRLIDRCVFLHPANHNRVVSACCTTYKALQILGVLYWNMWCKKWIQQIDQNGVSYGQGKQLRSQLKRVSIDCSPLSFKLQNPEANSYKSIIHIWTDKANLLAGQEGMGWPLCHITVAGFAQRLRLTQQQQY